MKFDCIIMNPPYGVNRNHESNYLHYYITEIATSKLTKTGICVSLMPISLISSTSTKKELLSLKDRYDKICCSIEQVDQSVFPDTNMKEICIYTSKLDNGKSIDINCSKLKAICSSLLELNYGITDVEKTILSKLQSTNIATERGAAIYIRKKDRTNSNEIVDKWLDSKKLKDKEYFICMSYANGGMNAMWQSVKLRKYGIVLRKNIKQLILSDTTGKTFLCFSKSEFDSCKNVFKLLNTNCLRFGLAKMQTDQNIQTKCYKYFPNIDYSLINSENDFYKYFELTDDEIKTIEDTMKKYEI